MSREKLNKLRPVWAEIDLDAISYNVRKVKELIDPGAELLAVVKGDGYGHGAVEVAKTALNNGVTRLGVAILEEAKELRRAGIEDPILVFGPMYKEQIAEFVKHNITPFISRVEMAQEISKYGQQVGKKIDIHIKLDTGMGRLGFLPKEALAAIKEISQLSYINVEGICSHLPRAYEDEQEAKEYTNNQIQEFKALIQEIEEEGISIPIKHLANSAGLLEYPASNFDLVRSGVVNYGLWPCIKEKATRLADELELTLKPALELKAKIAYTKELPAGHGIGYGSEYVTPGATKIGIIPLGWGDGYPRFLSENGEVLIKGERRDILGVICMDQMMVDLSDLPDVKEGTEVLLIGKDQLTAYEVTDKIDSINYELVTRLGARVPRAYLKNGEIIKIKINKKVELE